MKKRILLRNILLTCLCYFLIKSYFYDLNDFDHIFKKIASFFGVVYCSLNLKDYFQNRKTIKD